MGTILFVSFIIIGMVVLRKRDRDRDRDRETTRTNEGNLKVAIFKFKNNIE